MLSVAQLHAGALLALATRPGGLCATGSADGVLRLWGGGDLRAGAAVMEVQHEGPVTGECGGTGDGTECVSHRIGRHPRPRIYL